MRKEHKDSNLIIENKRANKITGIAIQIHQKLGPGLLESVYHDCLFQKIKKSGLKVEKEKLLPIKFEELKFDSGYRINLLVEEKLIIELKCVDKLCDVHIAQLLTYLRLGNYKLGLLLNFNVLLLKNGIKRIIN